jgi:tetratricopeptide (TPR) repeat protein
LADANAVLSARRARVIGLYATGRRLGDWNSGPPGAESFRVDAEEHSLAFVAVRQHDPRSVSLDGIGQLGHGWSGAPMVLPGTTVAIGCFARIDNRGPGWGVTREEARGPAVSQVPRLVGVHLDDARFHLARTPLPSPEDAHAACSLALQATSFLQPGRYASALEPARAFVQHRPNSAFGHKMLAYASEHVDQLDAAREEYQRSLELDPNGLNAQLLYAQFLGGHGEPNAAQRILEPLWKSGQTHDLVGIALVNALSQRKELARCLEILDEAIQSNPRNAYLWQQRAACHMEREGLPAAVEPMSRAVELLPERGPLRGTLAHLLERTGALDEAEKHFRKLLEVEPENPVVYYWLADFLRRHRPSLQEEAVQVAEKALRVPANSHLPREDIERLIKQIREAAGSPTPQ